MTLEKLRDFCISLTGVEECLPFDDSTLVFKVGGKMFALIDITDSKSVNLKCNPDKIIDLQERFSGVLPGYHMNKKHWITVLLNEDVSDTLVMEWIRGSYFLVFNKLSKRLQDEITNR
ncbi:MAG TPA: MmcQ-like protein [Crocinitomicaceae bacterium]|nr:MmcQ/YjbR family DNA-binding protein [Flavobacteriales bacterium]HBW85845.1 MmcQ-like protein [Crocinitomicaceae bacterium]